MNPFKDLEKLKNLKDRSKEKKTNREEKQQESIDEYFELRGLDKLSEREKELVDTLREKFEDTTMYSFKGSEAEVRQIEMMQILMEQNYMIIKLLNDIKNK